MMQRNPCLLDALQLCHFLLLITWKVFGKKRVFVVEGVGGKLLRRGLFMENRVSSPGPFGVFLGVVCRLSSSSLHNQRLLNLFDGSCSLLSFFFFFFSFFTCIERSSWERFISLQVLTPHRDTDTYMAPMGWTVLVPL